MHIALQVRSVFDIANIYCTTTVTLSADVAVPVVYDSSDTHIVMMNMWAIWNKRNDNREFNSWCLRHTNKACCMPFLQWQPLSKEFSVWETSSILSKSKLYSLNNISQATRLNNSCTY